MSSIYLERYGYPPLGILEPPSPTVGVIIIIPIFNEAHTLTALDSLYKSALPSVGTEVLLIINQSVDCAPDIKQRNTKTFNEIQRWIATHKKNNLHFYVKNIDFPKKHAGVGLARKAGMDEAIRRFELINNYKGVILCFDADCTCDTTYIKRVYNAFKDKNLTGASIYYEHSFNNLSPKQLNGITQYELHLRYYVTGLRKAGYPYAFHTVGSSMAVRSDVYKKAGGMNRRKAGEDFHFLHKVIPFERFDAITTTTVYPSARISDRVPFGTGKAMGEWALNEESDLLSYHPQLFIDIGQLLKQVPAFYKKKSLSESVQLLPPSILAYLKEEDFEKVIDNINKQSSTLKTFIHRWFSWMNGLKMLHLVHYLRDYFYPSIAVSKAAQMLIGSSEQDALHLLELYRKRDRDFKAEQISLKHLYYEYQ